MGESTPCICPSGLHKVTAKKSALSVEQLTRNRRKGLGAPSDPGGRLAVCYACRSPCGLVVLWLLELRPTIKAPRCVALVLAVLVSTDAPPLNIKYSENENFHLGEFLFTRGAVGGRSSLGE